MPFPNGKVIYEIPIYSMSKSEFQRRWDKWKLDIQNDMIAMGNSDDSIKQALSHIMQGVYPRNEWRYNQIVGFVEIRISSMDIEFNVNKTLDKRIHAVAKAKHFIQSMHTTGMHFRIADMDNNDIVLEIDSYLDDIEANLTKPFCLCRDVFDCIKMYINYRGIQMQIIEELQNT